MSDAKLLELERRHRETQAQEDELALGRERIRHGLCPWCGKAEAMDHVDILAGDERTCCCSECSVMRGPDWTRCGKRPGKAAAEGGGGYPGTNAPHCAGCPAVGCTVTPKQALAHLRCELMAAGLWTQDEIA